MYTVGSNKSPVSIEEVNMYKIPHRELICNQAFQVLNAKAFSQASLCSLSLKLSLSTCLLT